MKGQHLPIFMGIVLSIFTWNVLATGDTSRITIPRLAFKTEASNRAEYATHRPYKADFDLLRASEKSHEMDMPLLSSNSIHWDGDLDPSRFSEFDPTLRSRRRRQVQVQNPAYSQYNLGPCNTDPMCRQLVYGNGVTTGNGGGTPSSPPVAVSSASTYYIPHPQQFTSSSSSLASPFQLARNDLAINYYYQQQHLPQPHVVQQPPVPLQVGLFQGPIPVQRNQETASVPPQVKQYEKIHQKFPYPYPPALSNTNTSPSPPPLDSGHHDNPGDIGGTDAVAVGESSTYQPSDIPSVTTLLPPQPEEPTQQDPSPGFIPDSPQNQAIPIYTTTNTPSTSKATTKAPPKIVPAPLEEISSVSHTFPSSTSSAEQTLKRVLREKDEEIRILQSQLEQANQQIVSYEQEGTQCKEENEQLKKENALYTQENEHYMKEVERYKQEGAQYLQQAKDSKKEVEQFQKDITRLEQQNDNYIQDISQYKQQNSLCTQQLSDTKLEMAQSKKDMQQYKDEVLTLRKESAQYLDQYARAEEANGKLRDRVLQLENTNQHLQEQNGQLQQVTAEQRNQINGLKVKTKDAKEQLETFKQKYTPLSQEVQKHRKEIEDFLIRIRNMGEEYETCQKQVKLYQLKISYINDQQKLSDEPIPDDPEMSRMDQEIAALQQNAQSIHASLGNFNSVDVVDATSAPYEELTTLPVDGFGSKNDKEFPGEAVQVPPRGEQAKPVVTAEDVVRAQEASRGLPAGAWERPAGF